VDSREEGGCQNTRKDLALTGEDGKMAEAKCMIRAVKKVAYDILRDTPKDLKPKTKDPERRSINVCLTLEDRVGIKHLQHRVGRREELRADVSKYPWNLGKAMIRIYRLKNLEWTLWRHDSERRGKAVLPKLLQTAEEGDKFR
jgi:hypothetical protein